MSAEDSGTGGAGAVAAGGNCSTCGCVEFTSQFYRPALCNMCYHDIASHFQGDWKKVVEGGKVYYVANADPTQKLFARAADASDAVKGRVAVVRAKPKVDSAAAAAAGKVSEKKNLWEGFSEKVGVVTEAPPHLAEAIAAAEAEEGGAAEGEAAPASSSGAAAMASPRPLMRLPSVPVMADGTVLPSPAGIHVPGVTDAPAGTTTALPTATITLPTITESGADDDDNWGATQVTTDEDQPVLAIPEDVPEAPSAVPQAAFANLSLNLSELQNQLASPTPARATVAVDDAATEAVADGLAKTTLEVAPSPAGSVGVAAPATATTAEKEQWTPTSPGGASFAAASPAKAAEPAPAAAAPAPAAAAAAPASAPAPAGPTVDLSLHLAPIYDTPLLVDVDALLKKGAVSGVSLFAVKQPFEEDYAVPRHLLITPFTIMALAPHPTKLGVGILKWERSILSLRRLTAQPLFSKDPIAKAQQQQAAAAAAAAGNAGGAGASAGSDGEKKSGVMGFFKKAGAAITSGAHAVASAIGTGEGSGAGSGNGVTDADRLVPVPPPVLLDHPEALAKALAHPDAVGLLASFAPETTDTVALLRMYRAGARPVRKEGYLHKRKRQAWRERAPLGALGWKKRYFVLQPTHITYYGQAPEQGGTAKGVIPLTGWVEVAKVGAESEAVHKALAHDSTTRPHCFIVRTGRTHHVFQANSAEDCDAWITAISTNAQHVGMSLDDPHCLVLEDSKEMNNLAQAIIARRKDLLSSMSHEARKAAEKAFEVDLSMGNDDDDIAARRAALARRAAEAGFRVRADSSGMGPDGDDDDDDEEGGSGSGSHHGEPDPGKGPSLADAIAMVEATGGITEEILAQCSPAVRAKLLQYFGHTKEQQMRRAQHPSFRQPRPAGGAVAVAGAGRAAAPQPVREGQWLYLDDFDKIQGPFSDSMMRTWLWAGMLRPDICCRFALPLPGVLDASEGVDNNFIPQVLIPLSVLFTDPHKAFVTGDFSWVETYKGIAKFQYLFQTAVAMGVDRSIALKQTYVMKENGMPADLSILLDLCGVRDVSKLKKPQQPGALKPHPPPADGKHGTARRNSSVTDGSMPATAASGSAAPASQ